MNRLVKRKYPRTAVMRSVGMIGATVAASVLSVALCGFASAATASGSNPSAADPTNASDWIFFPVGQTLSQPSVITTSAGYLDAKGQCVLTSHGVGASALGGKGTAVIEIGLNPATCQAEYESGQLGQAPPSGSGAGYASTSATAQSNALPGTGTASDPTAYQDNQWLDPFGIQVSAQEQWLDWYMPANCASPGVTANTKWSWLGDGWSLKYSNNPYSFTCSAVETYPDAKMSNGVFCALQTTNTYFGVISGTIPGDTLEGYPDGSYYWNYNDSLGGSCDYLLHHGHVDHT